MKSLLTIVLFLIITYHFAFADDIILKNGNKWQNVSIVDTTGNIIRFHKFNVAKDVGYAYGSEVDINKSEVDSIQSKPINSSLPSIFIDATVMRTKQKMMEGLNLEYSVKVIKTEIRRPNWFLIPIGVTAGIVAWDYYERADQLSKQIDDYNKGGKDASEFETERTRSLIVGSACAVVGITSIILGFQTEQWIIYSNGLEIKCKYTF